MWKIFDSESVLNSLIYEKCQPCVYRNNSFVNTESSLHWGQKYEPLSVLLYELSFEGTFGKCCGVGGYSESKLSL